MEWLRRPRVGRVKFLLQPDVTFGPVRVDLYRLCFKLEGRPPGLSFLQIEWRLDEPPPRSVLAKWDETAEPLVRPTPFAPVEQFRPDMVPPTYYHALFPGRKYSVPIVVDIKAGPEGGDPPFEGLEVFSGWWYGSRMGFPPDPRLRQSERLRLTLTGAGLSWSEDFSLDRVTAADPTTGASAPRRAATR